MNATSISQSRVSIETSRHFASHMKPPRGRGGWMFENEAREHVFTFSGIYAEARKAAKVWAASQGVAVLYVCP